MFKFSLENLNVRNRCYRLQQPLDDCCTASKNGSLFVDIAILVTFLDKQHSSVQQCDQFICPVLTFPAMNDRCLRLSESRPVQAFAGRINPALRHITWILPWSRTGRPFRPRRCRSLSSAVVAFLLVLVLVLKDSLRTFFKSLSLSWSLGVRSLSLSLSLGVRVQEVL